MNRRSRVSNDTTVFHLRALALQPQINALRAQMHAALDDADPAFLTIFSVLIGLLHEHVEMAPPELRRSLVECVREALPASD
jgi:hypothetical protein